MGIRVACATYCAFVSTVALCQSQVSPSCGASSEPHGSREHMSSLLQVVSQSQSANLECQDLWQKGTENCTKWSLDDPRLCLPLEEQTDQGGDHITYVEWMHKNCPVTCGLCALYAPSSTQAPVPDPSSEDNAAACTDMHSNCSAWAALTPSECQANPEWMKENCKKSCAVCASTEAAAVIDTTTTTTAVIDNEQLGITQSEQADHSQAIPDAADFNVSIVDKAFATMQFIRIRSGVCGDHHSWVIKDKHLCEYAAAALKYTDRVASVSLAVDKPYGCYYKGAASQADDLRLWLNMNELNIAQGLDHSAQDGADLPDDRELLCFYVVPPDEDETQPPVDSMS